MTVEDVLDAINSASLVQVRASVTGVGSNGETGDRIVIEDVSGGTGSLIVADKSGGTIASDLGIAARVAGARIDGTDLIQLTMDTPLSVLNDGNGVSRKRASDDFLFSTTNGDFSVSLSSILATQLDTDVRMLNNGNGVRLGTIRVTDRLGESADIDLAAAQTVQDILTAINDSGLAVRATVVNSHFQIADTSEIGTDAEATLEVQDVSGFTAADLGLDVKGNKEQIKGSEVYRISTLGDVIRAINYAPANGRALVEASLSADRKGITLRALGIGNSVTVSSPGGSQAAADLGLSDASFSGTLNSRRLIGGLNTVLLSSLNGGRGTVAGTISLTDRTGQSTTIDLSSATTLQDVLDLINADSKTDLKASINRAGNGIALQSTSDSGTGPIAVSDLSGSLATDLGLVAASNDSDTNTGDALDGGSAQLRYISARTRLEDFNMGSGVGIGSFQITDSTGASYIVRVDDTAKTVGDIIEQINAVNPDSIKARINDTGDGIVVVDSSNGSLALKIEDREGGRVAADLRLAQTAKIGEKQIDGSVEIRIDIEADDTLTDIARKINSAGLGLSASVLTHGSGARPVSLTVTSGVSGKRGELIIDTQGVDLGFGTLSRAQDALVALGEDQTTSPILVSSSSNTLDQVLGGVTINLLSVSDDPVTVSIAQDTDAIVNSVQSFVDSYNNVLDTIDRNTKFDQDAMTRGPLLGDATVNTIRSRLTGLALRRFGGVDESMSRLFSIGIRSGTGGRLTFDTEKFREILAASPEKIERLFTTDETGIAAVIGDTLEGLTRSFDGLLNRKDEQLVDQQDLLNDRIDRMNLLVDAKRTRLEAQFVALEITLAAMQQQQNSLLQLSQLFS